MQEEKGLLAYCGFHCGDCLGYTGVIADAAQNLMQVLERYKFKRTAESVFSDRLRDYDEFCEMLRFMTGLRCAGICRQGEQERDPSSCAVKNCCIERGLYACYECDDFETCDKLSTLHGGLHAASCARNMRAIREMGLEAWLAEGKRYCYWNEDDGL